MTQILGAALFLAGMAVGGYCIWQLKHAFRELFAGRAPRRPKALVWICGAYAGLGLSGLAFFLLVRR